MGHRINQQAAMPIVRRKKTAGFSLNFSKNVPFQYKNGLVGALKSCKMRKRVLQVKRDSHLRSGAKLMIKCRKMRARTL
jgi:hypothetical protein